MEESISDDKGNFQKQRWHAMSIKLPKSEKDNLNSGGIPWSEPGWTFFCGDHCLGIWKCKSDHSISLISSESHNGSPFHRATDFPWPPRTPDLQPPPSLSPLTLVHSTPDTQASGMVCRHTKQTLSLGILLRVCSA